MAEIVNALPQLASLIEKGGVIGLLIIISAVLGREVWRLRKDLTKQYALRDKYRLGFALCKQELDRNKITIDLSVMGDLLKENEAQEA